MLKSKCSPPLFTLLIVLLALTVFRGFSPLSAGELNFGFSVFNQTLPGFDKVSSFSFNIELLGRGLNDLIEVNGDIGAKGAKKELYLSLGALEEFTKFIKFKFEAPEHKKKVEELKAGLEEIYKKLKSPYEPLWRFWLEYLTLTGFEEGDLKSKENRARFSSMEKDLIEFSKLKDFRTQFIKIFVLSELQMKGVEFFSNFKVDKDLKAMQAAFAQEKVASAQDHFILGWLLYNQYPIHFDENHLSHLVLAFEKAKLLDSRNYRLYTSVVDIYSDLNRLQIQEKGKEIFWFEELLYKKTIEIDPDNASAYNNLGFLYAKYGVQPRASVFYCKKAVELDGNSSVFRDSLGWAYFRVRDYKKAILELKEAIRLDPKNFEPFFHLGTLYLSLNQFVPAEDSLNQAIGLNPEHADSLNNLAFLLTMNKKEKKDLVRARNLVEKALELEPENHAFLDTLGWVYFHEGNYPQAEINVKKAKQAKPDVDEVIFHLGEIYLKRGQFSRSAREFTHLFRLNPNYPQAEEKLILTLLLDGLQNSEDKFIRLRGEKGTSPTGPIGSDYPGIFAEHKAQLFTRFNDFESASKVLKEALELKSQFSKPSSGGGVSTDSTSGEKPEQGEEDENVTGPENGENSQNQLELEGEPDESDGEGDEGSKGDEKPLEELMEKVKPLLDLFKK